MSYPTRGFFLRHKVTGSCSWSPPFGTNVMIGEIARRFVIPSACPLSPWTVQLACSHGRQQHQQVADAFKEHSSWSFRNPLCCATQYVMQVSENSPSAFLRSPPRRLQQLIASKTPKLKATSAPTLAKWLQYTLCEFSSFCRGAFEAFALLVCYVM